MTVAQFFMTAAVLIVYAIVTFFVVRLFWK